MRCLPSLTLLVLLCAVASTAHAQVCEGSITLSDQDDVDAFDCTELEGNLYVGCYSDFCNTNISDLTPLSGLTSVGGYLTLFNMDRLVTLEGLNDLAFVGRYLRVDRNYDLRDIQALSSLASIGSELTYSDDFTLQIIENLRLPSLQGLHNVTTFDTSFRAGVRISNNEELTSLAGLEWLSAMSIKRLQIINNDLLESIAALSGVAADQTVIVNNRSLTSVVGLEGLDSVVKLEIENNAITSLAGLENLQTVKRRFKINNNKALVSIAALSGLLEAAIGGTDAGSRKEFEIIGNDVLTSLDGLENLTSVGGSFTNESFNIEHNRSLQSCACGLAGLISGDPPEFSGIGPNNNITIKDNGPAGSCMSPSAVLFNPCGAEPFFEIDATASNTTVTLGEAVLLSYTIANNTSDPTSGDLWFSVRRDGFPVARAPVTSSEVPADAIVGGSYTQVVSGDIPLGAYTYVLNIGQFPFATVSAKALEIIVTSSDRTVGGPEAWMVTDVTPWEVTGETAQIEVASSEALPEAFELAVAYPNPFAASTTVGFALPEAGDVRLAVYDVLGREVAVLADKSMEAGRHTAVFEAAGLASGVYLVRMTAGDFAAVQRVTLAQ